MKNTRPLIIILLIFFLGTMWCNSSAQPETPAAHDARMQWWREARFGLFIHWGLYAIPAGEWKGKTEYGEWIRSTAEIPLAEYDKFVAQFNPIKFNADEWESTWSSNYGIDLYKYVRGLQSDVIINNRVGAARAGMEGFTKAGEFAGDFGTPEQQIPATGLPGVDWKTCMTMNDHWGYNKNNHNWKSTE